MKLGQIYFRIPEEFDGETGDYLFKFVNFHYLLEQ
jgi:hypothetical protein